MKNIVDICIFIDSNRCERAKRVQIKKKYNKYAFAFNVCTLLRLKTKYIVMFDLKHLRHNLCGALYAE